MSETTPLNLRSLELKDSEAIAEIEHRIAGLYRPEYWERKLILYMSNPEACIGAELDGRLIGFMLGHLKGGEFGKNDGTGWLEILGVDPEFWGKGIGKILFEYVKSFFARIGVSKIYTLVEWNDLDLVGYFSSLGFKKSEYLSLERDV